MNQVKKKEVDISLLPDVTPASFGRFWPLLKKLFGLRKINGVDLVDFFYTTNPDLTSRREGVRGVDYFSPEEFLVEINKPRRKRDYAAAFEAFIPIQEAYVKMQQEKAERDALVKRQYPAKFGMHTSPDAKKPRTKAKPKQKESATDSDTSESSSNDSGLFSLEDSTDSSSEEEEDKADEEEEEEEEVDRSRAKGLKAKAKAKPGPKPKWPGQGSKREPYARIRQRKLTRHHFQDVWQAGEKVYGFKRFDGIGRRRHFYSFNPELESIEDAELNVDYFDQIGIIKQLNARSSEFPEVFRAFDKILVADSAQNRMRKYTRRVPAKHKDTGRVATKRKYTRRVATKRKHARRVATKRKRSTSVTRNTIASSSKSKTETGKAELNIGPRIGENEKDETVKQFIKTVEAYKQRRLEDSFEELEQIDEQLKDLNRRKRKIEAYIKSVEVLQLTAVDSD